MLKRRSEGASQENEGPVMCLGDDVLSMDLGRGVREKQRNCHSYAF